MICFDTNEGRFNFRSVAVIIHNNHLLIHRDTEDDFWALPGGRVEFFETSEEAVKREVLEELGYKSTIDRQLWHVENFFVYGSKQFHEIANYFLVSLPSQLNIDPEIDFKGIETTVNLIFRWVPLEKLKLYDLKPEFLISKMDHLPSSIEVISINELRT